MTRKLSKICSPEWEGLGTHKSLQTVKSTQSEYKLIRNLIKLLYYTLNPNLRSGDWFNKAIPINSTSLPLIINPKKPQKDTEIENKLPITLRPDTQLMSNNFRNLSKRQNSSLSTPKDLLKDPKQKPETQSSSKTIRNNHSQLILDRKKQIKATLDSRKILPKNLFRESLEKLEATYKKNNNNNPPFSPGSPNFNKKTKKILRTYKNKRTSTPVQRKVRFRFQSPKKDGPDLIKTTDMEKEVKQEMIEDGLHNSNFFAVLAEEEEPKSQPSPATTPTNPPPSPTHTTSIIGPIEIGKTHHTESNNRGMGRGTNILPTSSVIDSSTNKIGYFNVDTSNIFEDAPPLVNNSNDDETFPRNIIQQISTPLSLNEIPNHKTDDVEMEKVEKPSPKASDGDDVVMIESESVDPENPIDCNSQHGFTKVLSKQERKKQKTDKNKSQNNTPEKASIPNIANSKQSSENKDSEEEELNQKQNSLTSAKTDNYQRDGRRFVV